MSCMYTLRTWPTECSRYTLECGTCAHTDTDTGGTSTDTGGVQVHSVSVQNSFMYVVHVPVYMCSIYMTYMLCM